MSMKLPILLAVALVGAGMWCQISRPVNPQRVSLEVTADVSIEVDTKDLTAALARIPPQPQLSSLSASSPSSTSSSLSASSPSSTSSSSPRSSSGSLISRKPSQCPPVEAFPEGAPQKKVDVRCPAKKFSEFDPKTGTLSILPEWRKECKDAYWHPCRPQYPSEDPYSELWHPGKDYNGPRNFAPQPFVNGVAKGIRKKKEGHECVVAVCSKACAMPQNNRCQGAVKRPETLKGWKQWKMSKRPRGAVNIHLQFLAERSVPERKEKLNVVVVLLDSTSRKHYLRMLGGMTERMGELQEEGKIQVFDFCDYHPQGKQTAMTQPIMWAGMPTTQARCAVRNGTDVPYDRTRENVYAHFRKEGYITAALGTPIEPGFTCLQLMENNPVVDFFHTRAYSEAEYSAMDIDPFSGQLGCLGNETTVEYGVRFLRELHRVKPREPKFAVVLDNIPHQYNQQAAHHWEKGSQDIFALLEEKGALKNTAVIFVSDHGQGFGPWAQTPLGAQENYEPFLVAAFPTPFLRRYPDAHKALLRNHKLTVGQYDFYRTLLHLASLPGPAPELKFGRSLLEPLPDKRPCSEFNVENSDDEVVWRLCNLPPPKVAKFTPGSKGWAEAKSEWGGEVAPVVEGANSLLSKHTKYCPKMKVHSITAIHEKTVSRIRDGEEVKVRSAIVYFNTTIPALWQLKVPMTPPLQGLGRVSLYEPDRQACPEVPDRLVPYCMCKNRKKRDPLDGTM